MCDESTDISTEKKLVVYCRLLSFSSEKFEPETVYLDNVAVSDGGAETIHASLKECAIKYGIATDKVFFLWSDGAAVMTGQKSEVAARMKREQRYLLNIHCMAHRLALCTSEAANDIPFLKKYRDILTNIFYYFKHSALRTCKLKQIEEVLNEKQLKIKEIHAVRWFAFYSALEAVFHTWGSLLTYMYFEQEKRAEKGGVAKGIHIQLSQFEFVAVTYFLMDVIPPLTKLSMVFQKTHLDISIVQPMLDTTKSTLQHLMTNDGPYTKQITDNISGSKLNLRDHQVTVTSNQLKHFTDIQNKFVNGIIAQLDKRFPQKDTSVITAFSVLGLRGINFQSNLEDFGNDKLKLLTDHYGCNEPSNTDQLQDAESTVSQAPAFVNTIETKSEWQVLKHLVVQERYPTDSLQVLWGLLNQFHKSQFPNLVKLAGLALIVPLQTADCERGFSVQNDLKTSTRSRLTPNKLAKLMRIAVDRTPMDKFEFERAFKMWRQTKDRRIFQAKR